MQILLPNGLAVVVDEEDADLARLKWYLAGGKRDDRRYAARTENDRTVYLHRVIAQRMGLLPDGPTQQAGKWRLSVDHINGNKLDNRRVNLRICDRPTQIRNPNDPLRSTNTSGHRGVTFDRSRAKWQAKAMVAGRTILIGRFETAEAAGEARRRWDEQRVSA